MKNILFCFVIALAILLPASVAALNGIPPGVIKMPHAAQQFLDSHAGNLTVFFDEVLADLSNDDDLNESERKKFPAGKSFCCNTSFMLQGFFGNCSKRIYSHRSLIPLPISLFILISQLRL